MGAQNVLHIVRRRLTRASVRGRIAVRHLLRSSARRRAGRRLNPRTSIARLGLIVTCVAVVVPPAIFATLSLQQLNKRALEQASLGARHIEIQLPKQHASDWLNQVSINVLHATLGTDSPVIATWLTDRSGMVRMYKGHAATWPEYQAQVPIKASGFEGSFHVALSTREVFVGTMYVALGFLVLGLVAYTCFRRLPLAALDEALRHVQLKQMELMTQKMQLEVQNLRFDAALNNMTQGLCMFDGDHKLLVCNDRYVEIYGLTLDQAKPGTTLREIVAHRISSGNYAGDSPESYLTDVLAVAHENRTTTNIIELKDRRVIAIRHQPTPGGGWLSTHEDITEFRRIEARIAHMAHHDVLTELPNRVLLRERLDRALAVSRGDKSLAVFCLDLDRFKDINDTLGHPVGDELLKAVAKRLRECVREGDTVARLGGDEFSIVQHSGDQPMAATGLASRIIEAFATPFDLERHQVTVGTSIGIAVSSADACDPDQLMKNADLALYRAKGEGRGIYRFFEADMDAHMQERSRLQLDLRKALVNNEFELYYQPVVNLERNEICGLEALLRWHHPERGSVSPADFIPLAEETGLIVPIGEWVLRQACTEAASWPPHIKVAVNLSAVQFRSRRLVDTVFSALAASGLAAHRLELEITESVLLKNSESTLATLHRLRSLGVRIALDDFGTGYSSLSYLRSFPFDKIKIDRCFVSDLKGVSDESLAILRAVAGLGSSLGIATTAEGVETSEQVERVREEGCTEMQGYFFSPPRPIKDITRLFLTQEPKASGSVAA